jgi:hypothetical protein
LRHAGRLSKPCFVQYKAFLRLPIKHFQLFNS